MKLLTNARLAWAAFLAWAATSFSLIAATLDDHLDEVPMYLTDTILWPNTMTLGAFFAVCTLLAFRASPGSAAFVAATLLGSVYGLAALYVTTEVEFLLCVSTTVVLAGLVAKCGVLRRPPLAMQTMALAVYFLYGVSVYAGHTMFLFPLFDEIKVHRAAAVVDIVKGDRPLEDPACNGKRIACFVYSADADRMGFRDLQWSYIAEVDAARPVQPVALELSIDDGLNNKADLSFVGIRHVDGLTAVAVSLPGHLGEWRVLAAKYFIASSSYTFLFLFVALLPTGLWLQRRAERKLSEG